MAWAQCVSCGAWHGTVDDNGKCWECRAQANGRPKCGWCMSTHVSDVRCTCTEPCDTGYCPAGEEIRYL